MGWIYGELIRSITLVPPHSTTGNCFEPWDVDYLVTMIAVTCPKLADLNLDSNRALLFQ